MDLFCGVGEVSLNLDRLGHRCYSYDITLGSDGDVLLPRNMAAIKRNLASGAVLGVMMAPPCSSFSVAMTRPQVARDRSHPWGKPGLCEETQAKVDYGNAVLKGCLRIVRWCLRYEVPFLLESPRTSWMFKVAELQDLVRPGAAFFVDCDQCMYGRPWRKSTRFLAGNLEDVGVGRIEEKCGGRGLCRRTTRPHWVLQGRSAERHNWTRIAQTYPPRLGRNIAETFDASARAHLLWLLIRRVDMG